MVLCIMAGNFDPLIFMGVMPLGTYGVMHNGRNFDPLIFMGVMPFGTYRIFVNQLTIKVFYVTFYK